MATPTSLTESLALGQKYQAVLITFNTMMADANSFISACNILASDPEFNGTATAAFKTWGTSVLSQVTTFVQTTTNPPAG